MRKLRPPSSKHTLFLKNMSSEECSLQISRLAQSKDILQKLFPDKTTVFWNLISNEPIVYDLVPASYVAMMEEYMDFALSNGSRKQWYTTAVYRVMATGWSDGPHRTQLHRLDSQLCTWIMSKRLGKPLPKECDSGLTAADDHIVTPTN